MTAVRPCPDKQARGIAVASLALRSIASVALTTALLIPATSSAQISSQPQSSITTSTAASFTPASVTLSGRVINAATGLPVPRALVRFNQRAMLADHEGRFQFDQITDTSINLQAVKPGFSMTNDPGDQGGLSIQVAQLTGPVEIHLYPEALLTGTVTSPDGAPLAQISVVARRSSYDEFGHRWTQAGQTQTDRHGDFRIPVPAGDYKLETRYVARNASSSDAILPVTLPASGGAETIHLRPGQEEHFDIQPPVRPTYPVSIGVESHGERGVPAVTAHTSDGASFTVGPARGPDQPQNQTQATFNLPAGTYTLTARVQERDSNETAETRVSVTSSTSAATQASGAVLRFVPTPSISVELSIDPDATSDNTTASSATTSSIQFSSSSNSTTSNSSTTTSSSAQNIPTIQQFGISLQRLDPTSEDDPPTIGLSSPRNGTSTFTAPPGTYRLVGRNAGHWHIRSASYGTTDLFTDPLVLSAGAATATIHLVVTNLTGSLQGTVLLNGAPAAAWTYLIATTPSMPSMITIHSGSTGTLNNPYLPPGTYRAIAFERRHSADFTNPETLARYASYVQSVTITSGAASSVNLTAVPQLDVDSEGH